MQSHTQDNENSQSRSRLNEKLSRNLGPVFINALHDPKTVELMLNADGTLWQERLGEPMRPIGNIAAQNAEAAIRTIAASMGRTVTEDSPILEGVLPIDGSRFAGWLPPVVAAPSFAVRKKASQVFTLSQYVEKGIMTPEQKIVIEQAVTHHKNILVIGGTGSGKTTLTNAIIHEMVQQDANQRIFIIEDTGEIQCSAKNAVQFYTSEFTSMTSLLKTTLRGRPDRILVGEVRGSEALDLLDAWNTGHEGGIATLHANNASAGLDRLKSMITRNASAPKAIEPLIGEAVHVIVHIARTETGRRIESILEVAGYRNGAYVTKQI